MSKNLTFTAYQNIDGEKCSIELLTKISSDNMKNVCGNLLNELFSWVSLQRAVNADGLKFSAPIMLKFSYNGKLYDTATWRSELKQRLKLQNTGKGKKLFAQRFYLILSWVIRERLNVTFDQLLEACDEQVLSEAN